MDQVKIGKFIAECRKKQNLTQSQLAEKLFITDFNICDIWNSYNRNFQNRYFKFYI